MQKASDFFFLVLFCKLSKLNLSKAEGKRQEIEANLVLMC